MKENPAEYPSIHLSLSFPHPSHRHRCTLIVPPQAGQVQRSRSDLTNARIPSFRIASRFSIMLMPYFVRYRWSRFRSRWQGKSTQLKQNFPFFSSQLKIRQSRIVFR